MAFAVACSSAEFLKAQPTCTLDDYGHLRAEFMSYSASIEMISTCWIFAGSIVSIRNCGSRLA